MSHHIFQTALNRNPVTVDRGWVRPLQYIFMTEVSQDPKDHPDEDSSPDLYSNLNDENLPIHGTYSVENLQDKLTELGISVPSIMLKSVQDDRNQDVGNQSMGIRPMGVFAYALVDDTIADCNMEDVFHNSRIDRWITAISSALGHITDRFALVVRPLRSRRSHEPAQDLPLGVSSWLHRPLVRTIEGPLRGHGVKLCDCLDNRRIP